MLIKITDPSTKHNWRRLVNLGLHLMEEGYEVVESDNLLCLLVRVESAARATWFQLKYPEFDIRKAPIQK